MEANNCIDILARPLPVVEDGDGGFLFLNDGHAVSLTNLVFSGNTALDGNGGAVAAVVVSLFTIDTVVARNNVADVGGFAYFDEVR